MPCAKTQWRPLPSPEVVSHSHEYVLNGIAYHEASHRLYVTGKNWDKMYQVCVHLWLCGRSCRSG